MDVSSEITAAHETRDPKLETIVHLLQNRFNRPESILVIGCGDGLEAAILADRLATRVIGVDVSHAFDPDASKQVELRVADAMALPFDEGSFDLVFSFHVLEHVESPTRALAEMRRVLRSGGGFWIGTPSRSRLIGYIGSRDATPRQKLMWNIADWRARSRGRFRNELGAHAGFTRDELAGLLQGAFRTVEDETAAYYASLYPRHRRFLRVVDRLRLARYVYPALYFAGRA